MSVETAHRRAETLDLATRLQRELGEIAVLLMPGRGDETTHTIPGSQGIIVGETDPSTGESVYREGLQVAFRIPEMIDATFLHSLRTSKRGEAPGVAVHAARIGADRRVHADLMTYGDPEDLEGLEGTVLMVGADGFRPANIPEETQEGKPPLTYIRAARTGVPVLGIGVVMLGDVSSPVRHEDNPRQNFQHPPN